uniref:Dynein regulatory complex protein 1-like n=1 Tax=Saccoglossus kowalevskii TaxID=10224 RepID=A0ABM0MZA5_SACKO|nr:PREDICTED: dynein regulatory complex protein 1-like [Saccoglossus kowalevskii]
MTLLFSCSSFLENVGPITSEASAKKSVSAHQVLQEVMSSTKSSIQGEADESELGEGDAEIEDDEAKKLSMKTIKQVLELLCDESGFLVESKLNKLLQPLESDERSLMKLDAIFAALGIETEEDIHKLATYFLQFKQVQTKSADKAGEVEDELALQEGTLKPESRGEGTLVKTTGTVTEGLDQKPPTKEVEGDIDEREADAEVAKVTGEEEEVASVASSLKSIADSLIHPNDVLKALTDFVQDHHYPSKDKGKYQTFKIISGVERDDSEDEAYWKKYASVLTSKDEKVWSALLTGFDKYSEVLNNRSKLISETDALRQQNAELRMLLHQYINSKVNNELEIPPTRVLNLEFNG